MTRKHNLCGLLPGNKIWVVSVTRYNNVGGLCDQVEQWGGLLPDNTMWVVSVTGITYWVASVTRYHIVGGLCDQVEQCRWSM